MEYLLYAILFLMLLAMSGFFRIHFALKKLDARGDQAQDFIMLFDRSIGGEKRDENGLRKLAVSSRKFQPDLEKAFIRAGIHDVQNVDIYQLFRKYRKGEADDNQLMGVRANVASYVDIVNFSQDHLRKVMLSPPAILKETGRMVTLQPMALYYSQEEEDPLSEDNKAAAKNMKKVAAIFFSVLGLILTAIAIINDWAAYFQTIFSLVE